MSERSSPLSNPDTLGNVEYYTDDDIFDDDDDERDCPWCSGEGVTEYDDDPGAWGEDCPSEENHLVTCSGCKGTGLRKDCDAQ